jgi:hypothetical protein
MEREQEQIYTMRHLCFGVYVSENKNNNPHVNLACVQGHLTTAIATALYVHAIYTAANCTQVTQLMHHVTALNINELRYTYDLI